MLLSLSLSEYINISHKIKKKHNKDWLHLYTITWLHQHYQEHKMKRQNVNISSIFTQLHEKHWDKNCTLAEFKIHSIISIATDCLQSLWMIFTCFLFPTYCVMLYLLVLFIPTDPIHRISFNSRVTRGGCIEPRQCTRFNTWMVW